VEHIPKDLTHRQHMSFRTNWRTHLIIQIVIFHYFRIVVKLGCVCQIRNSSLLPFNELRLFPSFLPESFDGPRIRFLADYTELGVKDAHQT